MSNLDDFKQLQPQPPKQVSIHGSVPIAFVGTGALVIALAAGACKLVLFGFAIVPLVLIMIIGSVAACKDRDDADENGAAQSSGGGGYGMIVIYSSGGGDSGGDGHHCGSDGGDGGDGGGGDGGGGD